MAVLAFRCIIAESNVRFEGVMRRVVKLVAALVMVLWAAGSPAWAAGSAPDAAAISAALALILNGPERLPLPIERIRPALQAHYIREEGSIYWVGTGRMTAFIQRLADAADDGLNPADYPIDALIAVRDSIAAGDPYNAAQAELFYSAFFVAYAADIKIGRVTPQKVDPRLFRSRKTIDVLRVPYHPS